MEMEELAKNIRRIRGEIDKIYKFYTWGDITYEEYKKEMRKLTLELEELEKELEEKKKQYGYK